MKNSNHSDTILLLEEFLHKTDIDYERLQLHHAALMYHTVGLIKSNTLQKTIKTILGLYKN